MLRSARRLALGIILIVAAGATLLYSDRASRYRSKSRPLFSPSQTFQVAFVEHASQSVLEDGARGIFEALAERGYSDGGRLRLHRYNAEADLATANSIAQEVVNRGNDLVITISTLSLQTVANANKSRGLTHHVFGLVTDPYGAGVGINRTNHLDHPPYLTGYGTMQPVAAAFKLARRMFPELKKVGLVWNPTESNSEAQTKLARLVCAELGIELLEANADNASAVAEAANSLTGRGIEALWVSGDVTTMVAVDALMGAAKRAKIPVFTVIPPHIKKGALFDLGANYFEVGRSVGNLAADVLDGRSPKEIPVENYVPEMLAINKLALEGLRDRWQLPDAILKEATLVLDQTGLHTNVVESAIKPASTRVERPPARKFMVDLLEYLDTPNVELARKGVLEGFRLGGFREGIDFEMRLRNAQGDMATLSSLVDAAITDNTDMIIPSTTPALQVALRRGRGRPTVFTLVANPVIAGAGKSETDHLPFVTGSYACAPHADALVLLLQCLPKTKRIGTLFVPAEVNSVFYKDELVAAATKAGLEVEALGISSSSEVSDGALAVCGRNIDVFCQISDNLTGASFASIGQVAARARIPLLSFASEQVDNGAFMALSRDFHDNGIDSGRLAVRVLRGEDPAKIPFESVTKTRLCVNLAVAGRLGINVPDEIIRKAQRVVR